jgi:hypothetical protein
MIICSVGTSFKPKVTTRGVELRRQGFPDLLLNITSSRSPQGKGWGSTRSASSYRDISVTSLRGNATATNLGACSYAYTNETETKKAENNTRK